MGLPLLDTPSRSPPPTTGVEDILPRVPTPEPVGEPEEPVVEPAQEPVQVQGQVVQAVERHNPDPNPVLVAKEPIEPLPVLAHPVTEPPMPLRVRRKEGANKVGDLVAQFEDANRRKPVRPPRMVEQTPISALVSTIRKGFEEMRPLPALGIVEEGNSVDMTPPPRPVGGLKIGGVKGLSIRSKSRERIVLTAVRLNS